MDHLGGSSPGARKVLEGIRVLEWSVLHAGPAAGAMLGDLGAEVIKIEEPGRGDVMRGYKKILGADVTLPSGRQVLFEDLNRNKKSVTANLKTAEGREIVYALVEKSDVFLTNYLPHQTARFSLDYETLSRRNSRLIYASGTSFGRKGPDAAVPAVEGTLYARSGMMTSSGVPGTPPTMITMGVADRIGGVYLAYAVLAALLARERTGVAQEVSASPLGGLLALQSPSLMIYLMTGQKWRWFNRDRAANPLWNYYQCKDGKWIFVARTVQDLYWPAFCSILGRPDLENDPRYDTSDRREKNAEELIALISGVFLTRTAAEWQAPLRERDIVCSIIQDFADVAVDPQALENQYIIKWNHPVLGPVSTVGFPVEFTKMPLSIDRCAPEVGQHTEEVLTEVCGYDWDKVQELRDRHAI